MKSITIHKLPDDIARKIENLSEKTGLSQNKVIKRLLSKALGMSAQNSSDDFSKFSGIWTDEEYKEFSSSTSSFSAIDVDLWK